MSLFDRILGGPGAETLYERATEDPTAAREHLETIVEYASSEAGDPATRLHALRALSEIAKEHPEPVADHVDVLRARLDDDAAPVRAAAIAVFRSIPPIHTIDNPTLVAMERALNEGTAEEQVAAARTVSVVAGKVLATERLPDEKHSELVDLVASCVERLLFVLRETDRHQVRAVKGLLVVARNDPEIVAEFGPELGGSLRPALGDAELRGWAAASLAITARENPDVVRSAVGGMVACLVDDDVHVRLFAASSLANLALADGDAALPAVADLAARLDDCEDVAHHAAKGLAALALDHPDEVADVVPGLAREDLHATTGREVVHAVEEATGVDVFGTDDESDTGPTYDPGETFERPGRPETE